LFTSRGFLKVAEVARFFATFSHGLQFGRIFHKLMNAKSLISLDQSPRPNRPGVLGWAHVDKMGRIFADWVTLVSFLKINNNFWLLFPTVKVVQKCFDKKWVGIHFRRFFHKLIWARGAY
jgi:hypothetical protein